VLYRWIDGVKYNRVLLDLATTRARGVCLVDDDAQVLINAARDGGEVEERTLALIAKTYKATTSAERALEAAAVSIAAAEKPGASVGSSSFDTSAVASARCSQELRADREVVLAAVKQDGEALRYASEELRADREVVMPVVQRTGEALQYASQKLKADREVVLAAVQRDSRALRYASAEVRADREVVLAAVQQDGGALEFASKELRADREVVFAAVKQNGNALRFASQELRAERGWRR